MPPYRTPLGVSEGSPGQAKRRPGVNVTKRFHSLFPARPRARGEGRGVSPETRTRFPFHRS